MDQSEKKKFKETAVGNWLIEKAPHLLDIIGDYFPPAKTVSRLIETDPDLTAEQKIEAQKLIQQYEIEAAREITKRIESVHELEKEQLNQEDIYTKRARPTRQYFWLIFLFTCYPLMYFAKGAFLELPTEILIGIFADFGFYTWKRTEEKVKSNFKLK